MKSSARVSVLLFLVLLAGALFFYRERIIVDAAYVFFHLVRSGDLQIQANRYGSFVSQEFPLIAAKMHLSFRAVLMAYSASFNVFYLLTAFLLYRMRQYLLLIIMGLFYCLYVSDAYFWPSNEMQQGICWMFLMFAVMLYTLPRRVTLSGRLLYYIVFTVLAYLAIYTHMTVIIPMVYLLGLYIIKRKNFSLSSRSAIIHTAILAGIIIFKMLSSARQAYDSINIKKILSVNLHDVLGTFSSGLANNIWQGWLHNYWLLPLMFLAGVYVLIRKKEFLLLAWTVLCNLGFFIVVCIVFASGGDTFYLESEFMPWAILGCSIFVYYLLPELKPRNATVLLSLIFLVRIIYICHSSVFFCERRATVQHIVSYMKEQQLKKIIIPENPELNKKLLLPWALGMESLYLSLLEDGQARTAGSLNEGQLHWMDGDQGKIFADPFGPLDMQSIPREYFPLDTTVPYRILPYDSLLLSASFRK